MLDCKAIRKSVTAMRKLTPEVQQQLRRKFITPCGVS